MFCKQTAVIFVIIAVVLFPITLFSEAPVLTATQLFHDSDLVCLARVEKVESKSDQKFAIAAIRDVWKGPNLSKVRYRAYPDWECDTSNAIEGESLLLFLTKEGSVYGITNSGQGRWLLNTSVSQLGNGRMIKVSVSIYDLLSKTELQSLKDQQSIWSRHEITLADLKKFLLKGIKPTL